MLNVTKFRKILSTSFFKICRGKGLRHQIYIVNSTRTMLGTMYYKCIVGLSSMQEMTRKFNDEKVVKSVLILGISPTGISAPWAKCECVFGKAWSGRTGRCPKRYRNSMIRRKTFQDARVQKKWQIIVNATKLDEGYHKKNDFYLNRCYNKDEGNAELSKKQRKNRVFVDYKHEDYKVQWKKYVF